MPVARPFTERFHEKYEKVPFSGCWIWTGSVMAKGGYGHMTMKQGDQRSTGAHRISWIIHRGEIPRGLWVLHKCDVPACVNPDHLFLGTALENNRDAISKGRSRRGVGRPRKVPDWPWPKYVPLRKYTKQDGENNHSAKLNWAAVRDIRTHRLTKADFARMYGVTFKAVKMVWDMKTWREVDKSDF